MKAVQDHIILADDLPEETPPAFKALIRKNYEGAEAAKPLKLSMRDLTAVTRVMMRNPRYRDVLHLTGRKASAANGERVLQEMHHSDWWLEKEV